PAGSGALTSYSWSASGTSFVLSSVTDAQLAPGVTNYTLYDSMGNVGRITNALSQQTNYTYNGFNQVLTVTDALSKVTTYTYDSTGNLTQEQSPLGHKKQWEYLANGDLYRAYTAQQVQNGKNSGWVQYEYDEVYGVVTRQTDSAGAITTWEWEPLRRFATSQTDPLGHTTKFVHNALGLLLSTVDPLGNASSQSYDALGNVIETAGPGPTATTTTFDRLNRVIASTNAEGETTLYTYDGNGNQLTVTNPLGVVTQHTYSVTNRLTKTINDYGVGGSFLNQTVEFEYDPVGNLLNTKPRLIEGRWRFTVNTYDALNRTSATAEVSVPDPDGNTTWTGSAAATLWTNSGGIDGPYARKTAYTYDAVGRQDTVRDPLNHATGTWVTKVLDDLSSGAFATAIVGDLPTTITDSNVYLVGTTANDGVYTASIAVSGSSPNVTWTITGITLPNNSKGGTLVVKNALLPQPVPTWDYGYDDDGRRTTAINALNKTATTVYNADGQVLAEYAPGDDPTSASVRPIAENRYDTLGRLVTQVNPLGFAQHYEYDLAGRNVALQDRRGNTWKFEYDAAGRLVAKVD
ncbi:MAG TPA: hypothetical protein VEI97_11460, partial [bacterium]|nr:hypothetical protein [bacterium]